MTSFMGQRILVNKHFENASEITANKFSHVGEIIISNEVGFEGIYIINTIGEVIKVGRGGGSESGGTPSGDYIDIRVLENYLKSHGYTTSADTVEISAMEVAKIVNSADTSYDTLKEIADWITNDTTGAAKMANDIAALQEEIQHVKSSDHVFLSRREYDELIASGSTDVSGETVVYSNDVYYCIYESNEAPTPGGDVDYIISGNNIEFLNIQVENNMIVMDAEVDNGFIVLS